MKLCNLYFHAIIIFIFIGLCLGNISLYKSWGTIINSHAIYYLTQPKEVYASISNIEWLISIVIWAMVFILIYFVYRKYIHRFFPEPVLLKLKSAISSIICLTLILIGARGGTQLIPINEGSAYFSSNLLLNQVATNPIWHLAHSLIKAQVTKENPYRYFDQAIAEEQIKQLYEAKGDSTIHVITIDSMQKPNIVMILLESWSADIVKAIGGEENVTPNFDQLKNDGILFSHIYSAGFRTDQGIVSILSGFPAQPYNSIIRFPEKTEKLPSLFREFKNIHYTSSFYYGGDIDFSNMNTYLLNAGCDKLIAGNNFNDAKHSNKWGVYDEYVLNRQSDDLNKERQPFFSVLLTLNTHEPFDIPIKNPFGDDNDPDKFRGAAYYTDQCLGKYFKKIKNEPWFKNTIFILLADHGHRLPKEHDSEDPAVCRMTLLFYGNLITSEYRGKVSDIVANQNDVAATLLAQFDINHAAFKWSNNIFNARRNDFAYISFNYGLCWVLPKGNFKYYFDIGKIEFPNGKENITDADISNSKSYIQCLYREFLDY